MEYMGRRCDVCRRRMLYGWKLGPREGNTMHRPAYCPDCLPEDMKWLVAAGAGVRARRRRGSGGKPQPA